MCIKLFRAVAGLIAIGGCVILSVVPTKAATVINFDFSQSGTGTLQNSVIYTAGSYSVTVSGLDNIGGNNSAPIYYSPESGLGIADHTKGNGDVYQNPAHSITYGSAIQISTAGLIADASSVLLTIGGTGNWTIRGSNTPGLVWGSYIDDAHTGPFTIDLVNFSRGSWQTPYSLLTSYSYITIIPADDNSSVYVSGLSVSSTATIVPSNPPDQIPEPSTALSLLIGLVILIPTTYKAKKMSR